MQRRALLLFLLFLALATFYAVVTRESVPRITRAQKNQTEYLNRLDEQVLGPATTEDGERDR